MFCQTVMATQQDVLARHCVIIELQKFTSSIVPQVKRELDFYQSVPEEKPPYILPNPPSPLITEPGTPEHCF